MDGSIYGGAAFGAYDDERSSGLRREALTARLAVSRDVLMEACLLRYAAYRSSGYVDEKTNPAFFIDEYDSDAVSKTIVIYKDDVPAATVRACVYDPATALPESHTLPAMSMFDTEIRQLLGEVRLSHRPARAVEITRMARHPDFAKNNEVILAVMRIIGYLVLHFDADIVFTAIKENHVPFYRRMGLRKVTEPQDYPKLNVRTLLMAFFRRHHILTQQRASLLDAVSVDDDIYDDLFSGYLVPLFGGDQNSGMLDCMFNRHQADVTVPAVVANAAMMSSRASYGQRLAA
jgi:hypothetical protein